MALAACGHASAPAPDGGPASASASASGAGGGGGGPATCDAGGAVTACDTCVFARCCAEEARCEAGTKCAAFVACAQQASCFGQADFLGCAVPACPEQATSSAVGAYQALAACIAGSCQTDCGL